MLRRWATDDQLGLLSRAAACCTASTNGQIYDVMLTDLAHWCTTLDLKSYTSGLLSHVATCCTASTNSQIHGLVAADGCAWCWGQHVTAQHSSMHDRHAAWSGFERSCVASNCWQHISVQQMTRVNHVQKNLLFSFQPVIVAEVKNSRV